MPRIIVLLTFNVELKAKFRYFTVALMLFYAIKNTLTCVIYFGNVTRHCLTFWRRNYFFNLAHPVYKM